MSEVLNKVLKCHHKLLKVKNMLNTARKMRERNVKGKLYAAIADSHLSRGQFPDKVF